MEKLEHGEKNLLLCWLYNGIYQHLPLDEEPSFSKIRKQALKLERVEGMENISDIAIQGRIKGDIKFGVWKKDPTPYWVLTEELFPDWKNWRKKNKERASAPKASTPPPPKASTSPPPKASTSPPPKASTSPPPAPPPPIAQNPYISPVKTAPESLEHEHIHERTVNNSEGIPKQEDPKPRAHVAKTSPTNDWENNLVSEDAAGEWGSPMGEQTTNSWETPEDTTTIKWWENPEPNYETWGDESGEAGRETRKDSQETSEPEKSMTASETSISEDAPNDLLRQKLKRVVANAGSLFRKKKGSSVDNMLSLAPLFTSDVLESTVTPPAQCGIFGKFVGSDPADTNDQPLVMLNTNTPWTTFICGVQGAGKSHSLTVMLESCLIPSQEFGVLEKPLAGVVFHFSPYNAVAGARPCEAAYLANPSSDNIGGPSVQSVTVLVSRSNFDNMKAVYAHIPNVTVEEFLLSPGQLTITAMQKLMSVQKNNNSLYIQIVSRVLRDMASQNGAVDASFDYEVFKDLIFKENLTKDQKTPLEQRLKILESFIGLKDSPNLFDAIPGTLTIVDLTCPFVDSETACGLFNICNELFTSAPCASGKVIALDEAHRYMSNNASPPVQGFAKSIIANIRVQRHIGVRTIISTQDPLIHPELLELSSMVILHRFSSPRWFGALEKYIGLENEAQDAEFHGGRENGEAQKEGKEMLKNIGDLDTGEAYIHCPLLVTAEKTWRGPTLKKFGNGVFKVLVREKVTVDGGASRNVL
ncbi:hypothetical protein TWF281_005934 [Arthrobotrys megalospora]